MMHHGMRLCTSHLSLLQMRPEEMNEVYLGLQEGVCDPAHIVLATERGPAHEQAAQDFAQLRHMLAVHLDGLWMHRTHLQDDVSVRPSGTFLHVGYKQSISKQVVRHYPIELCSQHR
jgi:hypothetical protein